MNRFLISRRLFSSYYRQFQIPPNPNERPKWTWIDTVWYGSLVALWGYYDYENNKLKNSLIQATSARKKNFLDSLQ